MSLESQLDLANNLNNTISEANAGISQLGENMNSQASIAGDFFSTFSEGGDALSGMAGSSGSLSDQLMGVANSAEETGGAMGFMNKAVLIAQKGYASFTVAAQQLFGVIRSVYNFITMNPVYTFLGNNLDYARSSSDGAFQAQERLAASLGRMPDTLTKFSRFMGKASSGARELGRGLGGVFGIEAGEVMDAFTDKLGSLGVGFDRFVNKMSDAAAEVLVFNEGLGLSMEAMESLSLRFEDPKKDLGEMAKGLVGGAQNLGLSIKQVGKNFDAAVKNVKVFGYMTNKELVATTLYATRLGMEMSDLAGFAEGFDTFESAAEKVGKLSTMFGIQLDTMEMVMADNPAEKMDLLNQALQRSGQSIDSILRNPKEARYLAETLGMSVDQIKKLQEAGDQSFGFEDAFSAAADGQKELTDTEALNVLAKEMKKVRTALSGSKMEAKTFFGAFTEGFQKAIVRTEAMKKITGAFANSLSAFGKVGAEAANIVGGLFYQKGAYNKETGKYENIAPLSGLFDPFMDYFDGMKKAAGEFIGEKGVLAKIDKKIRAVMAGEDIGDFNIFTALMEPFNDVDKPTIFNAKVQQGMVKLVLLLAEGLADAFRFIGAESTKWVSSLFDEKTLEKGVKKDDMSLVQSMGYLARTVFAALGDMFSDLAGAGGGLYAYFFGGEFQGKSISKEDSVFGGFFSDIDKNPQKFVRPGIFNKIGSQVLKSIVNMFSDSAEGDVLGKAGATLGEKFDYAMAVLKLKMVKALKSMKETLRTLAKAELERIGGAGGFNSLNGYARVLQSFLSQTEGDAMDSSFAKVEKEIQADIDKYKGIIERANAEFKSAVKITKDDAKNIGLSETTSEAVTQLRKAGLDSLELADGTILDTNNKNFPKIVEKLQGTRFHFMKDGLKLTEAQKKSIEEDIKAVSGDTTGELFFDAQVARDKFKMEMESVANMPYSPEFRPVNRVNMVRTGEEMAKDLELGYGNAFNDAFGTGGLIMKDQKTAFEHLNNLTAETIGSKSPSAIYAGFGEDVKHGFVAGLFGDDKLIKGSKDRGLVAEVERRMAIVKKKIEEDTIDIGHAATAAMSVAMKKPVSDILEGKGPMQVVVQSRKLTVHMNVDVTMNARDIALGIAQSPGGSYFTLNHDRGEASDQDTSTYIDKIFYPTSG